jgi:uroporphyrin-III C-methyltransferase/precorrin-2 dehydrogenase/sirohydrochlorin ferrochelatase
VADFVPISRSAPAWRKEPAPVSSSIENQPLFPVFLRLGGRPVLLVGGGKVAASKLSGLFGAGARVTVVAPAILPELALPGVQLVRRAFAPLDLDGKWLAVAAATPEVNLVVAAAAEERRVFVNAVDDADAASAYLGGVVRKAGVTLAISTDGRAPALAGLLREALEAVLPDELDQWLGTAERLRARWRAEGVPMDRRRPLLLNALGELYAARGAP